MFFGPGIFEIGAMRQAFFKRQAQTFFTTEEEQQAYLTYTEKLYLGATKTFKEIMKDTNQNLPNLVIKKNKNGISSNLQRLSVAMYNTRSYQNERATRCNFNTTTFLSDRRMC